MNVLLACIILGALAALISFVPAYFSMVYDDRHDRGYWYHWRVFNGFLWGFLAVVVIISGGLAWSLYLLGVLG